MTSKIFDKVCLCGICKAPIFDDENFYVYNNGIYCLSCLEEYAAPSVIKEAIKHINGIKVLP
jgi:recombinational DNA repair protein (RecF pathway)